MNLTLSLLYIHRHHAGLRPAAVQAVGEAPCNSCDMYACIMLRVFIAPVYYVPACLPKHLFFPFRQHRRVHRFEALRHTEGQHGVSVGHARYQITVQITQISGVCIICKSFHRADLLVHGLNDLYRSIFPQYWSTGCGDAITRVSGVVSMFL